MLCICVFLHGLLRRGRRRNPKHVCQLPHLLLGLEVGILLGTAVLVDDGPVALAGGGPDGRTDPVDTDGSPELELSW